MTDRPGPDRVDADRVDADSVAAWFAECYGEPPAGVWFAPGRANLIGEHTDYNEGWVLPFALEQGVVMAAAPRGDGRLAARSRQADGEPLATATAALAPGCVSGWAAYPAGMAWALCEAGYPAGGASLAIDSDLPQGAGLSSSAALECATALAFTALTRTEIPRPRLAALARRAENEFVGVPSGIMDQSACLLSEAGHALLLDCRTAETTAVPFDPAAAGLGVLIVDTRAQHELTGGEYARRRAECEAAARALGVPSLRDVSGCEALSRLTDPVLRRRARHVVTDNQRVHNAVALLRAGAIGEVGPLLNASHASLRDDFEVSWPEADTAVEAAVSAGALGARMIGGGFGGSVIALVPLARWQPVQAEVTAAFTARGWPEPAFFSAAPSAGARRLR